VSKNAPGFDFVDIVLPEICFSSDAATLPLLPHLFGICPAGIKKVWYF